MAWAAAWAVAAPALYLATDDPRLVLPFAPVATLGAALAIFVAFRNNSAFARWSEARAAWQSVLVAGRVLIRQVVASTDNAVATGSISDDEARRYRRDVADHLVTFAWALATRIRPDRYPGGPPRTLASGLPMTADGSQNRPDAVLVSLATRVKDGIREGALGQFDPISLEPQLVALNSAQGVIERIATTPTLRQYDYFTRRVIEVFGAVAPFAILGLVPDAVWLTVPLALILSGTFVVLAVTGAANDEPFTDTVTDVPVDAICTELEHDVCTTIGEAHIPRLLAPVDGYLW
jgi:ion channel-forming bestrophin family protein